MPDSCVAFNGKILLACVLASFLSNSWDIKGESQRGTNVFWTHREGRGRGEGTERENEE